jgi:hypothetical protein
MKRYGIAYCFFPKTPDTKVPNPTPQPEKTADPQQVGAQRKAEDQTLFGGIPDLRVDRSAAPPSLPAGGAGLSVPTGTMK